uniref:DNA-directed RNA polymerase RpoA/D/Rpb3-type domain-containing protein n=1 Tax=viral metagenome TaxID=1070528 RepID=A0A6C0BZS3_9ZZZZ
MIARCVRLEANRYKLTVASSTLPEALCSISHELHERSEAYCIRHHPHDAEVEFVIDIATLPTLLAAFEERLRTFTLEETSHEHTCCVVCPSFWVANIIRRALWTSVPIIACSSVLIHTNTSAFEGAMLAHRCGQLALQGTSDKTRGVVNVKHRDVLGKDIIFDDDLLRVAPLDREASLVQLRKGQTFHAELRFRRGRPLEHAKFHCVAAPSYYADVHLPRAPSDAEMQTLTKNGFHCDAAFVCTRIDSRPARAEVLKQIIPHMHVTVGPRVKIGVESLGQMPAVECVKAATDSLLEQAADVMHALTECERSAVGTADFCGTQHRKTPAC